VWSPGARSGAGTIPRWASSQLAFTRRTPLRAQVFILLIPLLLAGCGTTEHKTVIVNPPPNSTTTVDQNGNTHTTTNN
jgi:hypothetical protein